MTESAATASATPVLDLRNRSLAAVLALLVPGLGHLYQRRRFKAAIYSICILGLFFSGQALGNWKVVYQSDNVEGGRMAAGSGLIRRLLQGYGAQWWTGVVAWPAIVQSIRSHSEANSDRARPDAPINGEFRGGLWADTANGPVLVLPISGTVHLDPAGGGLRGSVTGTTDAGKPVTIELDRIRDLGRPISANDEQTLDAVPKTLPPGISVPADAGPLALRGGIARPFWNRYQVPLGEQGEDRLTTELGAQRVEMAFVFTWIAGLLNILAIWDAFDGPAYGFGHEPELNEPRRKRKSRKKTEANAEAKPTPQSV